MIVPMRELTLLCVAAERDATLEALRDLGVLHLTPIREPEDPDVQKAEARRQRCQAALATVERYTAWPDADPAPWQGLDGDALCRRVAERVAALHEHEERAEDLAADIAMHTPFGEVDPESLARLAAHGLTVRLYRVGHRNPIAPPQGVRFFRINDDEASQYIVAVGPGAIAMDGEAIEPPTMALSAMRRALEHEHAAMATIGRELGGLAARQDALRNHLAELEGRRDLALARAGMGEHRAVAYVRGYCPADREADVKKAAVANGWALLARAPTADDAVPTLIRYPRWVKPARALFDFLGILPGYRETDVAPSFMIFLSIFFAMIVGDAGYGLLLLALTLGIRRRRPDAAPEPFRLLTIFFAATVVWGVITANYFGIAPERLPAGLRALRITWLAHQENSMTLCFLLGAIHLTVAHAWNVITWINHPKALVQAGWIGITWTMFALARTLLLDASFPAWAALGGAGGAAAIVIGAIRQRGWMSLAMLPQDIIGNFGDLMSYLRLFALGLAGVKVAEAFNQMAGMIGFGHVGAIIGAVLVLILGHALNMLLCAMSVLVHGVRLNALEFSMHIGQEWTGFAYQPFACKPSNLHNATPDQT